MSGEWTLLMLDLIGAAGLASGFLVAMRRLRQSHHNGSSSASSNR
jgi:hypothetical protein